MKRLLLASAIACQLICQLPLSIFPQPTSIPAGQRQTNLPPSKQQPSGPGDEETVKITTNLVQVDAVITDEHGKLVTDLRPGEVRILEDGRSQKITT